MCVKKGKWITNIKKQVGKWTIQWNNKQIENFLIRSNKQWKEFNRKGEKGFSHKFEWTIEKHKIRQIRIREEIERRKGED